MLENQTNIVQLPQNRTSELFTLRNGKNEEREAFVAKKEQIEPKCQNENENEGKNSSFSSDL